MIKHMTSHVISTNIATFFLLMFLKGKLVICIIDKQYMEELTLGQAQSIQKNAHKPGKRYKEKTQIQQRG